VTVLVLWFRVEGLGSRLEAKCTKCVMLLMKTRYDCLKGFRDAGLGFTHSAVLFLGVLIEPKCDVLGSEI